MDRYFEANRANWDERVAVHLRDTTGIYRRAALLAGEDALTPIEGSEIGDVTGKRLLHLQCHFGFDTISLARRGAKATGLDFSGEAIAAARTFAGDAGVDADFVEGNVYDAPSVAGAGYDVLFTSWGAIGWLPDIRRWARVVAECLAPGGFLYLAEGHPTLFLLEEVEGRLEVQYDWRTPPDAPIMETIPTTYAGDGTLIRNNVTYGWNHPLSDILSAVGDAGLSLAFFHEHEGIPWRAFPSMVRRDDGLFVQREGQKKIPLGFSLKAVKGAGDQRLALSPRV